MKGAAKGISQAPAIGVVFVKNRYARRGAQTKLGCEVRQRYSIERIAGDDTEHPARNTGEVRGSGARRDCGQLSIVNRGGGEHSRRIDVPNDGRDGRGSHEVLSDLRSLGSVALVVATNDPERVSVDAAGFIDLFDGELDALQILKAVTLLPGPGRAYYVGWPA